MSSADEAQKRKTESDWFVLKGPLIWCWPMSFISQLGHSHSLPYLQRISPPDHETCEFRWREQSETEEKLPLDLPEPAQLSRMHRVCLKLWTPIVLRRAIYPAIGIQNKPCASRLATRVPNRKAFLSHFMPDCWDTWHMWHVATADSSWTTYWRCENLPIGSVLRHPRGEPLSLRPAFEGGIPSW